MPVTCQHTLIMRCQCAVLQQQFLDLPQTSGEGFSESFVRWLVQTLMRLPPEAP